MSHEEDRYNQHLATKKELTGRMWPDDEPEEVADVLKEIRPNLELFLQLLMRPHYVYKMARAMLNHSNPGQRTAAQKRLDNALLEIAKLLQAYHTNSLWLVAEEEKVKMLSKIQKEEERVKP